MADPRNYPDRPFLAVSAAIIRDGHVLLVQRARSPAAGLFTLPGGVVECGETLEQAVIREVQEETTLTIQLLGLAGHREVIACDAQNRVERHFVILSFAARWIAGEPQLNEELAAAHWMRPAEIAGLETTAGLSEIIDAAFRRLESGA